MEGISEMRVDEVPIPETESHVLPLGFMNFEEAIVIICVDRSRLQLIYTPKL